jgi:hypothetical protein
LEQPLMRAEAAGRYSLVASTLIPSNF